MLICKALRYGSFHFLQNPLLDPTGTVPPPTSQIRVICLCFSDGPSQTFLHRLTPLAAKVSDLL